MKTLFALLLVSSCFAMLSDTNYSFTVANVSGRPITIFGSTIQPGATMVVDKDRGEAVRFAVLVQKGKLVVVGSNVLNYVYVDMTRIPLTQVPAIPGVKALGVNTNVSFTIGRTNYFKP